MTKKLAIVGSSGGMKSVFVQGVFNALETAGIHADAYAGASGSALPAASAAIQKCNYVDVHYWQRVHEVRQQGHDMGETMLLVINEWVKPLTDHIFQSGVARLIIPASYVKTEAAAEQTQGEGAKRLGRRLLIDAGRKNREWVDQNLELHLYDTFDVPETHHMREDNIADVVYASLRMLHTSKVPAWIDGKPYVDTSYTSVCPALEMVDLGYEEVIAISTEPGTVYHDIFQIDPVPSEYKGAKIHLIQPEFDLATIGADFTECTDEGVLAAFRYGEERGREFLKRWL